MHDWRTGWLNEWMTGNGICVSTFECFFCMTFQPSSLPDPKCFFFCYIKIRLLLHAFQAMFRPYLWQGWLHQQCFLLLLRLRWRHASFYSWFSLTLGVGFLGLGYGLLGYSISLLSLFPFITICFTGILNIFFYMVNYRHQINLTSHLFEISHMIEYSTL